MLIGKTILVFGRSEFLTESKIKAAMALPFDKLAINHAIEGVDYVAYIDKKELETDAKIVTITDNGGEFYLMNYDDALVDREAKFLAYFGFTHDFVLSWCILRGYANVILIGTADFQSEKHYDGDDLFIPSRKATADSLNAIENIYTQELNIFTMNKNSKLQVDRITLKELK